MERKGEILFFFNFCCSHSFFFFPRYIEGNYGFPALFISCDCFGPRIFDSLDKNIQFDFVSCQFALHYAFESEERARRALENITDRLKPGGHFVGTIINVLRLVKLFRHVGHSWANPVCALEFDKSLSKEGPFPEFGAKYTFTLIDAVGGVPEYFVHFDVLQRLAKDYGLQLVMREEFPAFFNKYKNVDEYGELYGKMLRKNPTPAEWEAINLYQVFCFKKIGEKQPQSPVKKYSTNYEEILKF